MSNADAIICKFCKICVHSNGWSTHVTGKKHKKKIPCRILIKGILEKGQIDEAHEYFAQFGKIKAKRVDVINEKKNEVVLHYAFHTRTSHSTIAHRDHTLFGNKMTVLWKTKDKKILVDTNTTQKDVIMNEEPVVPHENSITTCQNSDATGIVIKQEVSEDEEITTYEVSSSGQFIISKSDEDVQHKSSGDDSNMSGLEDGVIRYDELEKLLKEKGPLNNSDFGSDRDETNTSRRKYSSRSRSSSYDRRRKRSRSYSSRSRSRSPERRRLKWTRSRSRSRDSRHSRSSCKSRRRHSVQPRKSFLEEIRDKLNAIGNTATSSPNSYSLSGFNVLYPAPPPSIYQMQEGEAPQCDLEVASTNESTCSSSVSDQTSQHVNKLLSERKISLSDYLTITGKDAAQSQKPNQEEKDTILSQCEEALRAMSNQHLKRLRVPETPRSKLQQHVSPLLKSVAKFKFTSPFKDPTMSPFAATLLKILHSIGVLKQPNDIKALIASVTEDLCSGAIINNSIAAKILQVSLLSSKSIVISSERKKVVDVGTQCIKRKSISVQIDEEDLRPKKFSDKPSDVKSESLLGNKKRSVAKNSVFDSDKNSLKQVPVRSRQTNRC